MRKAMYLQFCLPIWSPALDCFDGQSVGQLKELCSRNRILVMMISLHSVKGRPLKYIYVMNSSFLSQLHQIDRD
jgi:hypothetical protein